MSPQGIQNRDVAARPADSGGRVARLLSPLIVIAALASFAFWGHHTGWRFAVRPTSHVEAPATDLLRLDVETDAASCLLHGLPICPTCSPGIAEISGAPPKWKRPPAASVSSKPPESLRRVQRLAVESTAAAEQMGIAVEPVWTADIADAIEAPGELQLDPRLIARIAARVGGTAKVVKAKRGDSVKAGDFLAAIDSTEVGRLKAAWLRAVVQARLKQTALRNITIGGTAVIEQKRRDTEAEWREAEARLGAAEQALVNLRLRPPSADQETTDLAQLAERMRRLGLPGDLDDGGSTNLLPVVSPQDGVLLSSDVVSGERVEPSHALFVVADTRRLVAIVHVAGAEAQRVRAGQSVRFRPDGADADAEGKVVSIATRADESTRRLAVRVEVLNSKGAFRAGTLGRGRILVRAIPDAVVVPKAAVAEIDGWPVVFVRDRTFLKEDGRKSFQLRPIHLGVREGDQVEVRAGLVPGEIVVTKGLSLMNAEYHRQRTGAKMQATNEDGGWR